MSTNNPRLFLIDGMALIYRAHFAMSKNPLITSDGRHTSAIFGFINMLMRLMREENPEYLAVALDSREPTFRHQLFTDYKATREKMPGELVEQLEPLYTLLELLNVSLFRLPGWEADDIIGTMSQQAQAQQIDTYMVTGDKDMAQLVTDHIFLYTPATRFSPTTVYNPEGVENKWGVPPRQIIDYLTLVGDSSDNVPGVDGVGPKNAVKLLRQYDDLDTILAHRTEVGNKRIQNGLIQGSEIAPLARDLVTIRQDAPLELHMQDLQRSAFDIGPVTDLLKDLEIYSLIDVVKDLIPAEEAVLTTPEKSYETITDLAALDVMISQLQTADLISFDLETTSVNPLQAEIVGLSFSIQPNAGWYVAIRYPGQQEEYNPESFLKTVLERLLPLFSGSDVYFCGQNIKYDALVLSRYDIQLRNIQFDTMIAAHLLTPEAIRYKLDYLSLEFLNYRMVPITDLIGTGRKQISMAEVPLDSCAFYAAEDADVALQLTHILKQKLDEEQLQGLFTQIEIPLIPVLIQVEKNGVFLDQPTLLELSDNLEKTLTELTGKIHDMAGHEFNINSPQQLAEILFDEMGLKPVRKRSTDVTVLERLKYHHPLPALVLDYRHLKKLKSTYLDAFPDHINPDTQRVHTSLNQTIAVTGRLSSTQPNFQNIPIRTELGREIRKAFRAQNPDWVILSADYSQIELRVMAHFSQEPELLNAFHQGIDIHTRTASLVFNVPTEEVSSDQRRTAKVVNFGIMYGAGPYRLSQELSISMAEAQQIIDTYFNTYPGIRRYVDQTLSFAREKGYVQTLMGRRRRTPNLLSDRAQLVQAEERAAINMPIQGTAAELIKIAMINIHRRLLEEKLESKMILQIHDELLFECPKNELDQNSALVIHEMENAAQLTVPLVVDFGVGDSWYEAH